MNIDEILNQLNLESEAVAFAIIGLAVAIILILNRKRLLTAFGEWRIQRILNRIGSEQIRNLVCPDGLDGYYELDRLALTDDAILLITYKPYSGIIYCAERISQWTQLVEQKSFKFDNPLFDLDNQLTALRLLTGNVPLHGYLFFNHSAVFPKGHPGAVLHPDNIPERYLAANCHPVNPEIKAAWETLKTLNSEASSGRQMGVKT